MNELRKQITRMVEAYFGTWGVTRSRLMLFLRELEPFLQCPGGISSETNELLRSLQTMTIILRRRADGEPIYVLREGRLAGSLTTAIVQGKSPREFFSDEINTVTLPMVERAFQGEQVQFTYQLEGRTYLTLLCPHRVDNDGRVTEIIGSMVDVTDERRYACELEHRNRLFHTLIEQMPCGIVYEETSPDGNLIDVIINPEFTRLTGYTLEQFLSIDAKEFGLLIHPEDRQYANTHYNDWLTSRTDSPLHIQYRFFDRNGIERWLDNYVTRVVHPDGRNGILQVVLDITERAITDRRLRHVASYLEQSLEPIIECDLEWNVTFLNHAAQRVFSELTEGSSLREHPIGKDIPAMIESEQENSIVSIERRAYMRRITSIEQGWRLFCHDVTPLVEAEQTLRRALEHEQAMNLLRSQFVATLSHEFRTPLAGILMSAQMLQRYGEVMTKEQREETVHSIVARVHDIEHIVVSFTRRTALLGRTAPQPVTIELLPLLTRVAHDTEIVRRKRIQVDIASNESARTATLDAELIRITFEALIDNAARYSPDDSRVEVGVHIHDGRCQITIRDHGVGIPDSEIDRLFTPYFRSSRTGNIPGSGLSLASLRPIVEAAGGTLSVQNCHDGGVLATLELPCNTNNTKVESIQCIVNE